MWLLHFMLPADKISSLINLPINKLNSQKYKRNANYKDGYITRRRKWPTQTNGSHILNIFIFHHHGRTILKWVLKHRMEQCGPDL